MDERVRRLFLAAIDLAEDERAAFLDRECGDDAELRATLASLVRDHLERSEATAPLPAESSLPDTIGGFQPIETLGRGGFGIVYLAHQNEPVKRTVALKMILLGMDTHVVLARFEAERQHLAMMDHPNIAQMFEAGETDDGRPYFVMEYVPGIPITEYCDRNRLAIEERLKLFLQVCSAVQHAHQKGVIHRDIKPSNVLVTSKSGGPIAKVIDFGVAKAIDRPMTAHGVFTMQGQLIGTPEYMSPEQAEMRPEDIDTRTDIYSLGVLLYELLTGALPFDPKTLRARGLAEIYRVIREVDPPRPSTRVSTMDEHSGELASARRVDHRSLVKELRDDLDWITMKAMEKDRTRRYASASEFAEDVQRHLRHEPVVACPPSSLYRVAKFVRRHRIGVAAAAAIALALLAGIVGTTWQMLRAQELQKQAERREQIALRQAYLGHLNAASLALEVDQLAAARRHLDLAPAVFRGWEWRHLRNRLDDSCMVLEGHARPIVAAVVDPAGELAVSADASGSLRSWSPASGGQIAAWQPAGLTTTLALDPGATRLAVAGDGPIVRILDARSRAELLTLEGHEAVVTTLAFAPDGTTVASGDATGVIRIWDLQTGTPRSTLSAHDDLVLALQFGPDGRQLASTAFDGKLLLWDLVAEAPRALAADDPPRQPPEIAEALAFSPDGSRLAVGRHDARTVEIWSTTAATRTAVLQNGHSAPVTAVAFSPDGLLIASGSADRTLRLWDAATGQLEVVLRGHTAAITSVAFTLDGTRVLTASADRTLRLWDPGLAAWRWTLRSHASVVHDVAAGRGRDASIWSASGDRQVIAWSGSPWRPLGRWNEDGDLPAKIAADPLRARAVIGTGRGRVLLWTPRTAQTRQLGLHQGSVSAVAFAHDGSLVASSGADGRVCVWAPESGERIACFTHEPAVAELGFSAADDLVVTVAGDDTVRLWSRSGRLRGQLRAPDHRLTTLAVDGRGTWVAAAGVDGIVFVWELGDPTVRHTLIGHDSSVMSLAFQPPAGDDPQPSGHERLVSGSSDMTIRVWDVAAGEQVLGLHGHEGPVFSLEFSSDGARLFSASMDATVRVWDTMPASTQLGASSGRSIRQSPGVGGGGG